MIDAQSHADALYEYSRAVYGSEVVLVAMAVKQAGLILFILPFVLAVLNTILQRPVFGVTDLVAPWQLAGFAVAAGADVITFVTERSIRRRLGWQEPKQPFRGVRAEFEKLRADRAVVRRATYDAIRTFPYAQRVLAWLVFSPALARCLIIGLILALIIGQQYGAV